MNLGQCLAEMQAFRHWYERKPLILSGRICHRQAHAPRNVSEKLQTVFQGVIRIVFFALRQNTHCSCTIMKCASGLVPECFTRYMNWKK